MPAPRPHSEEELMGRRQAPTGTERPTRRTTSRVTDPAIKSTRSAAMQRTCGCALAPRRHPSQRTGTPLTMPRRCNSVSVGNYDSSTTTTSCRRRRPAGHVSGRRPPSTPPSPCKPGLEPARSVVQTGVDHFTGAAGPVHRPAGFLLADRDAVPAGSQVATASPTIPPDEADVHHYIFTTSRRPVADGAELAYTPDQAPAVTVVARGKSY
jgi:hypothetical protein